MSCVVLEADTSALKLVYINEKLDHSCSSGIILRAMAMMRSWTMCFVMVLLVLLVLESTQAQQCDLTKLSSCLSATRANVMPTGACCQALSAFNSDAGIACVCSASSDPRFTSLGGRPEFAVLIPQKCRLPFKAGTRCNGLVIPGGQ